MFPLSSSPCFIASRDRSRSKYYLPSPPCAIVRPISWADQIDRGLFSFSDSDKIPHSCPMFLPLSWISRKAKVSKCTGFKWSIEFWPCLFSLKSRKFPCVSRINKELLYSFIETLFIEIIVIERVDSTWNRFEVKFHGYWLESTAIIPF